MTQTTSLQITRTNQPHFIWTSSAVQEASFNADSRHSLGFTAFKISRPHTFLFLNLQVPLKFVVVVVVQDADPCKSEIDSYVCVCVSRF